MTINSSFPIPKARATYGSAKPSESGFTDFKLAEETTANSPSQIISAVLPYSKRPFEIN
ncbi:MAG: hypothetical protein ACRC11_12395 [Xenococcaceae cyanobacterium]